MRRRPQSVKPDGTAWKALADELDAWRDDGRVATFWWRDDDATRPTPALRRLLAIARRRGAAPCVAVIPARSEAELAALIDTAPRAVVLQHGHAHEDLSPATAQGRAELSTNLPDALMMHRLDEGRRRLRSLFGRRYSPVVVPPWNRIDDRLGRRLPQHGFVGLSTFGPRAATRPVDGLRQVNAHCDLLDWKRGGVFRGAARALHDIVEHLHGRRSGTFDPDEPTGILTHHLDHDAKCWTFLDALLAKLVEHPATRVLDGETFGS